MSTCILSFGCFVIGLAPGCGSDGGSDGPTVPDSTSGFATSDVSGAGGDGSSTTTADGGTEGPVTDTGGGGGGAGAGVGGGAGCGTLAPAMTVHFFTGLPSVWL
ncbi:MAG: hypothetical protein QF464_08590, partial [Myxococcota bacterium]|nr:hypothetical protein [Myxococcota bacterium]